MTVFEQDADLRYTFVYNPPPGTVAGDYIGRTDFELLPEHDQRKVVPAKQRVLATGQREKVDYEIAVGGTLRYYDLTLDAKIGDISHTQAAWGRGFFDEWRVDAVTVNPFVGADGVRPLLADRWPGLAPAGHYDDLDF